MYNSTLKNAIKRKIIKNVKIQLVEGMLYSNYTFCAEESRCLTKS